MKKRDSSIKLKPQQKLSRSTFEKQIHLEYQEIYEKNKYQIGWAEKQLRMYENFARKYTAAIVGAALGDEGKGRLVDNLIQTFLQQKQIKKLYLIRFQGGNNAGHTVEQNGIKLALHVVPSGVFHKKAVNIMDRGMIIHPEDLQTEVIYAEKKTGTLQHRLFLSDDAILCTDLERAEEQVNAIKEGKSKGGTGRGIGPSYAHHYDKTGLRIVDLMEDSWKEVLSKRYDRYEKDFETYDLKLANITVPDFYTTKKTGIATVRTVGDKQLFLKRLLAARSWLIKRKIVINTFRLHDEIAKDPHSAILFEGAQAAGLDAWIGTRPDVTASNTSVYGIREGTGYWRIIDIQNRYGVIKIPYTSSVGARRMPTHIGLPKNLTDLPTNATAEEKWGAYIREAANEYGTTTGRPRDINHLDLALITYNAKMSGSETLVVTHADICKASDVLKVCTHYTDKNGKFVPYQPGLRYLEGVIPNYIELPGWDGAVCQKAKTWKELPENCLKFLAFIQKRTSFPIVAATTGPDRNNFVAFPGYVTY